MKAKQGSNPSGVENLIDAAERLLEELDDYETRQLDENDEFGPTTCVGQVREAIKNVRQSVPDVQVLISEAVQRAFAEVELEPDARSEYAEGIRATGRQLAKSFKVTPDAKKIYYVSFTFTETGHPYFDTVLITPAEAEKIWDWLDKRQAADLIANAKVSSLDKLPDYDGIMENLRENDMLALDEDEDAETVSSVENVSDLAERFDEKNGTPEQDEAESD